MDDVALDEVLVAEFWEVGAVFNTGSGLDTLAIVEGTVVASAAEEGWEDVAGCCEALVRAAGCWLGLDGAKEDCWIGLEETSGFWSGLEVWRDG